MKTTASWHATTRHFTLSAGFLASAFVQTGCFSSSCRQEEILADDDDEIDEVLVVACADQEADEQPNDGSFTDALRGQPIVTPLVIEDGTEDVAVAADEDGSERIAVVTTARHRRSNDDGELAQAGHELATELDFAADEPGDREPGADRASAGEDAEVLVARLDEPVAPRRQPAAPQDPAVEAVGEQLPPSLMTSATRTYGVAPMGGSVLY